MGAQRYRVTLIFFAPIGRYNPYAALSDIQIVLIGSKVGFLTAPIRSSVRMLRVYVQLC